jgi:hypothetical protein
LLRATLRCSPSRSPLCEAALSACLSIVAADFALATFEDDPSAWSGASIPQPWRLFHWFHLFRLYHPHHAHLDLRALASH